MSMAMIRIPTPQTHETGKAFLYKAPRKNKTFLRSAYWC